MRSSSGIRRPTEDAAIARVMREWKRSNEVSQFEKVYTGLRRWDLELIRLDREYRKSDKRLHIILDLPSIYIQRRLALVSDYLSMYDGDLDYLFSIVTE